MNANNPKAPPPAPRPEPICPNCERSGGRHFPACPLEGYRPRNLHRAAVPGCDRCHGSGTAVEDGLVVRCTHCGGTGGH